MFGPGSMHLFLSVTRWSLSDGNWDSNQFVLRRWSAQATARSFSLSHSCRFAGVSLAPGFYLTPKRLPFQSLLSIFSPSIHPPTISLKFTSQSTAFSPRIFLLFSLPREVHASPHWAKDIIRKSIETPNLAHRNLESEPTNRDPAWGRPKPFIYMWQLCSLVYLQNSEMGAGSVSNALLAFVKLFLILDGLAQSHSKGKCLGLLQLDMPCFFVTHREPAPFWTKQRRSGLWEGRQKVGGRSGRRGERTNSGQDIK